MKSVLRAIAKRFPGLVTFRNKMRAKLWSNQYKTRFQQIYENKSWGRNEPSVSGEGSSMARTEKFRAVLPEILRELGIKDMLDLPCGDFFWMKTLELPIEKYQGGDIVPALIETNNRQYAQPPARTFSVMDIIEDPLPQVDLILCRDCMIHLAQHHIMKAIRNIKNSGSEWLLLTNNPEINFNSDIITGECREVNFLLPPYNFPPPLKRIDEGKSPNEPRGREIALWKISSLPSF